MFKVIELDPSSFVPHCNPSLGIGAFMKIDITAAVARMNRTRDVIKMRKSTYDSSWSMLSSENSLFLKK
jgi:hypothetical protein